MTLSSVGYVIGSGKDAPATHLPIGIPATRWPERRRSSSCSHTRRDWPNGAPRMMCDSAKASSASSSSPSLSFEAFLLRCEEEEEEEEEVKSGSINDILSSSNAKSPLRVNMDVWRKGALACDCMRPINVATVSAPTKDSNPSVDLSRHGVVIVSIAVAILADV